MKSRRQGGKNPIYSGGQIYRKGARKQETVFCNVAWVSYADLLYLLFTVFCILNQKCQFFFRQIRLFVWFLRFLVSFRWWHGVISEEEVKRERHFSQTWLLSESIQKELKGTVVFPMLFVRALLSRFRVLSTLIQRQANVRNSANSADFDKTHPFYMHHIFGFCHQPSVLICKVGSGLVWVWAEFGLWIDRL